MTPNLLFLIIRAATRHISQYNPIAGSRLLLFIAMRRKAECFLGQITEMVTVGKPDSFFGEVAEVVVLLTRRLTHCTFSQIFGL